MGTLYAGTSGFSYPAWVEVDFVSRGRWALLITVLF